MAKVMVTCPRCRETFDRNSDIEAMKVKNRWWHINCYKLKEAEDREKTEQKEKKQKDKEQREQDKLMGQGSDEQRKELYKYICQIFGLKAPGPKNIMLINSFYEKYGYTYSGIHKALYYHYEINKSSTKKASERIGIVPYIYDDAMEHFRQIENKKQQLANKAQHISQDVVVVTVAPRPRIQPNKTIDINSL